MIVVTIKKFTKIYMELFLFYPMNSNIYLKLKQLDSRLVKYQQVSISTN